MAAVSGKLTAAGVSASFTPSNGTSDVIAVKNSGVGELYLEALEPTSGVWTQIGASGAYGVLTPDTAILYRFRATGSGTLDFDYYMGP